MGTTYNKQQRIDTGGLMIPDSSNTERQVLADLISNPGLIPTARGIVNRSLFSVEAFARVWDILNDMIDQGITVDWTTVNAKVKRDTITELMRPTPGLTNETMDHCRALLEISTRRSLVLRAYELMTKAANPGTDFAELLSMPGNLVADLTTTTRAGASTQPVGDVLNDLADTIEADQVNQDTGKRSRVPTGIPMLDKITYNGFNAGNLIVLSARPSVGKTAVMLQMALAASRAGFPVIVYSLEMTNRELGQRLVFSTGYVTPGQLANNTVKWDDLERANGVFYGLPLRFNDKCQTLDEICNDILLNHQRGQCSVAFIDHLHRIRNADTRQSSYQAVTERSGRFKSLAMECGIPVVLLCQLNRMSETENRPPDLRDLRDSGSIEQDADIVLMLERATHTRSDPEVNMWVRKNRQGEAGEICIRLRGNRSFTVFDEVHETIRDRRITTPGSPPPATDQGIPDLWYNKN